jgi:predicted PurR-regulated permease PerM
VINQNSLRVIIILVGLLLVLIPSVLFVGSVVEGAKTLKENLDNQTLAVPPPDASVADWPLIGQKLYDSWNLASNNLESAVLKYRDQISAIAEKLLKEVVNIGGSILQFVLATIIAGILLATKGTQDFTRKFFSRLVGEKSDEYAEVATRTVSNVTKGVLGVALDPIDSYWFGVFIGRSSICWHLGSSGICPGYFAATRYNRRVACCSLSLFGFGACSCYSMDCLSFSRRIIR